MLAAELGLVQKSRAAALAMTGGDSNAKVMLRLGGGQGEFDWARDGESLRILPQSFPAKFVQFAECSTVAQHDDAAGESEQRMSLAAVAAFID